MHSRPVETLQLLVVLLLTCNCVAILNLNGVLSRLDFSLRGNSRPPSGRVTGLQLLYSISDTKVADLVNGTVFVVNEIPGMSSPLFSVQATVTAGSNIRSIQFGWNNNSNARIESRPPYALCGNSGRDFVQCPRLGYGVHTISATPFAGRRAKGQAGQPLVVTFSIVSNRNGAPIPPSAAPKVAPSPTGFPPTPVSNQIVTPLSPMAAPTVAALPPTRVVAPISVQIPPVQAPVPAPLKSPIAPTRFPIAPTRSPIAPTRSPIVPAPVVAPVVQSPTTPQTCSIPKVSDWKCLECIFQSNTPKYSQTHRQ